MMDAGCYAVSMVRFLAGAEPEVVSAEARLASPAVDRWMRAELRFPDGRTGRITAALFSAALLRITARAIGDEGEMAVLNPLAPHFFHRLRLRTRTRRSTERVPGDATYTCQLRAFARAVGQGERVPTDGAHGVANMAVIDAIYRKAGLSPRGT